MDIYILYKSGFYSIDPNKTVLGIYKLTFSEKYIFEFFGNCSSVNVERVGGFKNIPLSKFKHSEIKNGGVSAYLEVE